jgi:hypothetical protein
LYSERCMSLSRQVRYHLGFVCEGNTVAEEFG